jgi:hypothetical protein
MLNAAKQAVFVPPFIARASRSVTLDAPVEPFVHCKAAFLPP